MDLDFSSTSLRKAFESRAEAVRFFGEARGKKYVMVLNLVKQSKSITDLYKIPQLKFHPLKGDRRGEFAATLTGNWRIVLSFRADASAKVERVEDYHGR